MLDRDLRVGNIVADDRGSILEVTAIGPNWVTSSNGWHDLKNIRGIPLTLKRLAKCGFKEKTSGTWYIKGFYGFEISLVHANGSSFQAIHPTNGNSHYVLKHSIQFVHQLQNLFHALEDQEMKIEVSGKPIVNV